MKDVLVARAFRRLLGGWTLGNLADSALFLTLAVWVKDLSGSSSAAGLIFLALAAPVALSPLIGLLTDRVRRRPLLIWANLTGAVAALSLLAVEDVGQLWLLYGVAFAYGALGLVNSAAQNGLVRDMLPDEHLDAANAILTTVDQGLRIISPVIGAALYSLWGGAALATSVAACLVLTCMVLLTVQVRESAPIAIAATVAIGLAAMAMGAAADVGATVLLPISIAAVFVAGMAIAWLVVAMVTTRQRLTPPGLQGRAAAAANVAMTIPQMASIATGAALLTVVDYRWLLIAAGAVLIGCALPLARTPEPEADTAEGASRRRQRDAR
jgi:MFS family permease